MTKGQHDLKLYHSWPIDTSTGVHLTKGQPAQISTKLGHEMSLHRQAWMEGTQGWGYI